MIMHYGVKMNMQLKQHYRHTYLSIYFSLGGGLTY